MDQQMQQVSQISGDTHSYKGWLNSDSFLKRAFAILGYNTVATLIIQIPLMIIIFMFMGSLFFAFAPDAQQGMPMTNDMYQQYDQASYANEDMAAACQSALSYMTFADGAAADAFLAECMNGKYPEVLEQFNSSAGVTE